MPVIFDKHNPHQTYLKHEMMSFLIKRTPTDPVWNPTTDGSYHLNPYFDGLVQSLRGHGSANFDPVAWSVRLMSGANRGVVLRIWKDYARAFLKEFMGTEAMSRIYCDGFIISFLIACAYGDEELRGLALKVLRYWYLFNRTIKEGIGGRILLVGQRSAGNNKVDPWWIDWQYDLAVHNGNGKQFCKFGRAPQKKHDFWSFVAFLKLEKWAKKAAEGILVMTREDAFAEMATIGGGLRTEYFWLYNETKNTLIHWTPKTINGNTAPILGTYAIDGIIGWMPTAGGMRIRDGSDKATCYLEGNEIRYRSKRHDPVTLVIPHGIYKMANSVDCIVKDVVVDGLGIYDFAPAPIPEVIVGIGGPGQPEIGTVVPKRKKWWEKLFG